MIDTIAIRGAAELIGKGVYRGLPDCIPSPARDRHAVVTGDAIECAAAAARLGEAGWNVTIVTRERRCSGVPRRCRRRTGADVVCATGGEYLEVVVLRRLDTGRIDACIASALFILPARVPVRRSQRPRASARPPRARTPAPVL